MRLLFFICILSLAFADHDESTEFITDLTVEAFNSNVEAGTPTIIMFYAPWCGHCKHTMPLYNRACQMLGESLSNKLTCARVDCTKNEEFCIKQKVQGYPTIKSFRGDVVCDYKGARSDEAMAKWATNFYNGFSEINDVEQVKQRVGDGLSVVAYLGENSELKKVASSMSCELISYNLVTLSDANTAKAMGIEKVDSFNVFANGSFVKTLDGVTDAPSLMRQIFFATTESAPNYSQENVQNIFSEYVKYYIAFFYDNEETLSQFLPTLKSLEESQNTKLRVFTVNGSDPAYKDVKNFFHVPSLPYIVFYNDTAQNYRHFTGEAIDSNSLSDFAEGCLNGTVPLFVLRQAIPEGWEKEKVKVLVTDTHDKIFEMCKHVIVKYYAPWCGHCQAMKATYEKLGDLAAEKYPDLCVADMDHTANFVGNIEIQGYPTVVLYKTATDHVFYQGDRTLADLEKFIQTHLYPDQLPAEKDEEKKPVSEPEEKEEL